MNAPPRKRRTLVREPGPDVAEATGILIDEVLSDAELAPFTPSAGFGEWEGLLPFLIHIYALFSSGTVLVAETAPNRANDLLKWAVSPFRLVVVVVVVVVLVVFV